MHGDIQGQLIMRQAAAGEYGQFLAPHQTVQDVDGGDAGFDEVRRFDPAHGVENAPFHRNLLGGRHRRAAVYDLTHAVKNPAQNSRTQGECYRLSGETDAGARQGEAGCGLQDFDGHVLLIEGGDAAQTFVAVGAGNLDHFVESGVHPAVGEKQWTLDTGGGLVQKKISVAVHACCLSSASAKSPLKAVMSASFKVSIPSRFSSPISSPMRCKRRNSGRAFMVSTATPASTAFCA